jgi:lipopolysaccharide/colanic/teichoic acid biosynthesis glycosyltransferase
MVNLLQMLTERLLAAFMLLLLSPVFLCLYLLVKLDSRGPFIFRQLRLGRNRRPFTIYKIRTMGVGAEAQQVGLAKKNEADGPIFKIKQDPRFTKVGYWLARSGLDELPQLWNVMRGEMAFVGPRPFPVGEAAKISKRYHARFSVLPGITSLWILKGIGHRDFHKWMEADLEYVREKSWLKDCLIIIKTINCLWLRPK